MSKVVVGGKVNPYTAKMFDVYCKKKEITKSKGVEACVEAMVNGQAVASLSDGGKVVFKPESIPDELTEAWAALGIAFASGAAAYFGTYWYCERILGYTKSRSKKIAVKAGLGIGAIGLASKLISNSSKR